MRIITGHEGRESLIEVWHKPGIGMIMNSVSYNENRQGRIRHLDMIKAAAIFFVLYDHGPLLPIGSVAACLSILVSELGPAVFFMVSGAVLLHREDAPASFFARIVKTYVIMVFWKLCYLLLAPLAFSFPGGYRGLAALPKGELLIYLFFFGNINGISTQHFWFTHAYLCMLLAVPFLRDFPGLRDDYDRRNFSASHLSGQTPDTQSPGLSTQTPDTQSSGLLKRNSDTRSPGLSKRTPDTRSFDTEKANPLSGKSSQISEGILTNLSSVKSTCLWGKAAHYIMMLKQSSHVILKKAYEWLPLLITYFLGTFPFTLKLLTGKNGTFLSEMNPFGNYSYMMFFFVLGGYLYRRKENGTVGTRYGVNAGEAFPVLLLLSGLSVQLWLYRRSFASFGWQGQYLPGHSYMSSAVPIAVGSFLLLRRGAMFLEGLAAGGNPASGINAETSINVASDQNLASSKNVELDTNVAASKFAESGTNMASCKNIAPEGKGAFERGINSSERGAVSNFCEFLCGAICRIGRNTLVIYYMHMLPMQAVCSLLSPHVGIGINILKALLLIAVCGCARILLARLPVFRNFV